MSAFRQHTPLTREERISDERARIERRTRFAADVVVAVAIGVGLAALLVAWWSS